MDCIQKMINPPTPLIDYKVAAASKLFIDKSDLISEAVASMENGLRYLCVTRPRRFGKTYGANMVASFFGKDYGAKDFFASQKVGADPAAMKYCGKYNVVYFSGDQITDERLDGKTYKELIRSRLISELQAIYHDVPISPSDSLSSAFCAILAKHEDERIVVVIDEWDFILNRKYINEDDTETYISFLRNMLKGQPIIQLAYLTGILPMPIFSSTSDLNMFIQCNMSENRMFSTCFGFTEEEVDQLYQRYRSSNSNPVISRDDLRKWYEGYTCAKKVSIYNPQSVTAALSTSSLEDYWCQSGAADEIFSAISDNVLPVCDDIAYLTSGLPVPIRLLLKKSQITSNTRRDAILSRMVALGFLSYEDGKVRIPNKELMEEFENMILDQPELDYIHKLAIKSSETLQAVLDLNSDVIANTLEYVHNTEIPLLQYNHETDLVCIVTLAFINARNKYNMQREDKAGVGFVDFIFYPYNYTDDGIILELKVEDTPDNALKQIKDRKYALKFQGKLGEAPHYRGRIIAVGIAYDKKTKKHSCKIEILRDRIKP